MNKKHIFFYRLLRPLVVLFIKIRFGYTYDSAKDLPENYIVLSNHTTDYDLLFVAASFKRHMYFVGSEHIARWGFLYKLLKFAFAPIMRPKGTSAAQTIKEIMRATKAGNNVCMFAEGVRSWDGTPSPITPSTAKMVKRLGCGLVTYRITGGYFASPMWGGASVRRGPVHGTPMRVLTKEQIATMSADELYRIICDDLGEDAYDRQLADPKPYKSKTAAEGLENLLFLCPQCGARDTFRSHGDTVECTQCQLTFHYDPYGMLTDAPFSTLKEFAAWQRERVAGDVIDNAFYTAPRAELLTVRNHEEELVDEGPLFLSREILRCGETELTVDSVTDLAMHGQHHLVFTAGGEYYELKIDAVSNALKFHLFYLQCKQSVAEQI